VQGDHYYYLIHASDSTDVLQFKGEGDIEACQLLGNLCVLALYDETNTICQAYQAIAKDRETILSDPFNDQ
jgi:Meckelin (Transmembrane protein 67)